VANVLIRNPAGKVLFRDGKVAFGHERCCGCYECTGCSGNAPSTLIAEIDATDAFGNPLMVGGMGCGGDPVCHCYGCTLVGGTYAIVNGVGSTYVPTPPGSCVWGGVFDAPGYQAVCNGDQSDNGTAETEVYLTISYDGTNYWAQLTLFFAAMAYIWYKNLGSTKPTCSSVFPLTFVQAESQQQEFWDWSVATFGYGHVSEPCDLRLLAITVDLP
jgi:hypothetical protein